MLTAQTWRLENRKGTTGLSCQRELKKAKKFYFQCLNGNLDADKKKVQSGDEEGSKYLLLRDRAVLYELFEDILCASPLHVQALA